MTLVSQPRAPSQRWEAHLFLCAGVLTTAGKTSVDEVGDTCGMPRLMSTKELRLIRARSDDVLGAAHQPLAECKQLFQATQAAG